MEAKKAILISSLILFIAGICSTLMADALTGFYTMVASGDQDFGGAFNWPVPGMIESRLGPHGLPVLSATGIDAGSGDPSFFRTVHWQGTFTLENADQIVLFLQADDDVWIFVDGVLVAENHHGYTSNTSANVSAGVHSIDVFYGDRFQVYDAIQLISSVPLFPIPEPTTICLFGFGVLSLARRKKRAYVKIKIERDKNRMLLP